VEFQSDPADRSIKTLVDHEQRQITWISNSSTDSQDFIFRRFDHLIDPESKRRFLEATVAGQ
jgi:hypothetical protein